MVFTRPVVTNFGVQVAMYDPTYHGWGASARAHACRSAMSGIRSFLCVSGVLSCPFVDFQTEEFSIIFFRCVVASVYFLPRSELAVWQYLRSSQTEHWEGLPVSMSVQPSHLLENRLSFSP